MTAFEQALYDLIDRKVAEAVEPLQRRIDELEKEKSEQWLPASKIVNLEGIKIKAKTIADAGREGRIRRVFERNGRESWAYLVSEVKALQEGMKGHAGKQAKPSLKVSHRTESLEKTA